METTDQPIPHLRALCCQKAKPELHKCWRWDDSPDTQTFALGRWTPVNNPSGRRTGFTQ